MYGGFFYPNLRHIALIFPWFAIFVFKSTGKYFAFRKRLVIDSFLLHRQNKSFVNIAPISFPMSLHYTRLLRISKKICKGILTFLLFLQITNNRKIYINKIRLDKILFSFGVWIQWFLDHQFYCSLISYRNIYMLTFL